MNNNIELDTINVKNGKFLDMESFSSKLKKEDEKQLRLSKSFFWIYIGFICLYSVFIILFVIEGRGLIKFLSQLFYLLSFVAFVLIFKRNLKIFNAIDYSAPLVVMLKSVIDRYKLRTGYFLIISIPILLMDVGLTLSFYEDLTPMEPINRVLIVQVFYLPVMIISAFIGVMIWRVKQKPLCEHAQELIKELEE